MRAPSRPLVPALKAVVKRAAAPRLYPYPASALQPQRLYAYLDALWQRRQVEGAVLEVGCWLGGTAALAYRMLAQTGFRKRYVCVDTFSGFTPEQFDHDLRHGTPGRERTSHSANSIAVVRRLLDHYGCPEVELVEGDIATVDDRLLPERVAVCLLDVDLELPTYEGLRRAVPRLAPGGVLLVDDCAENDEWPGARPGYVRFVREHGLPERYFMDMGVVEGVPTADAPR